MFQNGYRIFNLVLFTFQVHPVVSQPRVTSEELLAPEDIKITYSETDNINKDNNKLEPETDPEEPMTSALFDSKASAVLDSKASAVFDSKVSTAFDSKSSAVIGSNAYNNFEAWNQMYGDEKSLSNEKVEAPRVLPSTEKQDQVDKPENTKTGKNLNFSSEMGKLL